MGRSLLFLPLVFLLVRDFGLFSGPDNFVNRLGAHFEQPGYLGDRSAQALSGPFFTFSAVSLPAGQRLRVVQWPG